MSTTIFILSASLSMLIINKINAKHKLFKNIESKINSLNEKKERKLRVISYILVMIIYGIVQSTKIDIIIQGLIFGALLSFRDLCFGRDLLN